MIDIAVSGLVKEFEVGKKILDGLTFQVDTGERVGLLRISFTWSVVTASRPQPKEFS